MTEQANRSTELSREPSSQSPAAYAANLLCHYSFDLGGYTIEQLLAYWFRTYPEAWVRFAIVEALYQGRYKAVSVEQILAFWQRRGQPLYHFNHEFERLVCNRVPRSLVPPVVPASRANQSVKQSFNAVLPYRSIVLQLPSLKAAAKLQTTPEIPTLDVTPIRVEPPEPDALNSQSPQLPFGGTTARSQVLNHLLELVSHLSSSNGTANGDAAIDPSIASNPFGCFGMTLLLAGVGSAADSLHPKLKLELATLWQTQALEKPNSKDPIHQFIPDSGSSDFCTKLKAVAQPLVEDGEPVEDCEQVN